MTTGRALGGDGAGSPATASGSRSPALLVWGAAITAYGIAVLHRSSLGVAAVDAAARFDIGATVLSTFVVVQLAVYAGMQVPLGVLLDRFGSRVLIGSGAVLMAVGQLLLGVVHDLPPAYLARVLIGAGDAATFISAIRLVPAWFPARRVPFFTQLTGIAGHVGQLAAAFPLVAVIGDAGWSAAFVGLGAVGVLASVLAWVGIRDRPAGAPRQGRTLSVGQNLVAALRTPGTWLGFWSHVIGYFPIAVFLLLWGFPFLTEAQGLEPAEASVVMSMNAVAAMISGPMIGLGTSRHPLRRSWMVLAFAGATAVVWTAVLLRPGPSPMWLLSVLVLVLGVGGPVSAIGFDYARTSNPTDRLGTAIGVVNVGGFSVAVAGVLAIGVVLDAVGGDVPMSLPAFRVAFALQVVPWVVAVLGVLVARRRAMRADGVVLGSVREALARRRVGRSGAS